jgi:hypothetical protein
MIIWVDAQLLRIMLDRDIWQLLGSQTMTHVIIYG